MREVIEKIFRRSFFRMGFIAGLGWLLDTTVYLTIATMTGHLFVANMIGNCFGITFAFILSVKHAFAYCGIFSYRKFIFYATFAFAMMPIFSGLLSSLVQVGWFGMLEAKIIVIIPSFIANYLFLKWLTDFFPKSERNA